MSKLGVLNYGEADGYPFNVLFDGVVHIDKPKDLNASVDALVFWGGTDIWAGFYGEKPNKWNQNKHGITMRDTLEWTLMRFAAERHIPMIGVCRGAQMMCAHAGGKLIQDASNHVGTTGHELETFDKSRVYSNTCHHQIMVLPNGDDNELLAWTNGLSTRYLGEDEKPIEGLVEYKEPEIVHFKKLNAIGIQGHPEWMERGTTFVDYCLDIIKDRIL